MSSCNEMFNLLENETKFPKCICKLIANYNYLDGVNNYEVWLIINDPVNSLIFKFPFLSKKKLVKCLNFTKNTEIKFLLKKYEINELNKFIIKIQNNNDDKDKSFINKLKELSKIIKKRNKICKDIIYTYKTFGAFDPNISHCYTIPKKINKIIEEISLINNNYLIRKYSYKLTNNDNSSDMFFNLNNIIIITKKIYTYNYSYEICKNIAYYYGLNNNEIDLITNEKIFYK